MFKKILMGILFATIAASVIGSCASCANKVIASTRYKIESTLPPADRITDSVALVYALPGPLGQGLRGGTGFAVDADHVLTAGHVCQALAEDVEKGLVGGIGLGFVNGHGLPNGKATASIVRYSMTPDLCLLYAPMHTMSVLKITERYRSIRTGDPILMPGAPGGLFPVIRDGRVSSLFAYAHGSDLARHLLLDVVADPGNSGSPVIWNGEVIGILTKVPDQPQRTAFAETASTIRHFLTTPPVVPSKDSDTIKSDSPDGG